MAAKKGLLGSAIEAAKRASPKKLASLGSRLPFLKHAPAPSPEPFSAIEDDTPLGDLLSAQNAAPVVPKDEGRESIDVRGLVEGLLKRPAVLIGSLVVLGFILLVAAVSIIVSAPPKVVKSEAPFTKEGLAVIKAWLPPPGDPLEPRIATERDGSYRYGPADAAKLGLPDSPIILAAIADGNDAEIEALYGSAP